MFNINSSGPSNAVASGRYEWTEPLSPGIHTVKYRGKVHVNGPALRTDYSEDIIYNIGKGNGYD
jgi:hypothetical protein